MDVRIYLIRPLLSMLYLILIFLIFPPVKGPVPCLRTLHYSQILLFHIYGNLEMDKHLLYQTRRMFMQPMEQKV